MELITWDHKYDTGIEVLDNQHKQLIEMTNELYNACMKGDKLLSDLFKETMHHMVEYVHFHFSAELKFMKSINYPGYHDHKLMHDKLIKDILAAAKDAKDDKKFVPNNFVRILRDWIIGHIAVYDKDYALYVKDQRRLGLITDQMLKDI